MHARRIGAASAWDDVEEGDMRRVLEGNGLRTTGTRATLVVRLARHRLGPPQGPSAETLAFLKKAKKDAEKQNTLNKLLRYIEAKSGARAVEAKAKFMLDDAAAAASSSLLPCPDSCSNGAYFAEALGALGGKRKLAVGTAKLQRARGSGNGSNRGGDDDDAARPARHTGAHMEAPPLVSEQLPALRDVAAYFGAPDGAWGASEDQSAEATEQHAGDGGDGGGDAPAAAPAVKIARCINCFKAHVKCEGQPDGHGCTRCRSKNLPCTPRIT